VTKPVEKVVGKMAGLHPLLDSNESTLEEQCFKKVFHREEFYLTDHQVNSRRVLPGVVYLEMAVTAGNLANRKSKVRKLTNIVWARPITVSDQHKPVQISLYPTPSEVEFEVSTLDDNQQRQLHRNDSEALSRLQLPKALTDSFNEFVLHPSLMDGALLSPLCFK